jgi:hypothetical protein
MSKNFIIFHSYNGYDDFYVELFDYPKSWKGVLNAIESSLDTIYDSADEDNKDIKMSITIKTLSEKEYSELDFMED